MDRTRGLAVRRSSRTIPVGEWALSLDKILGKIGATHFCPLKHSTRFLTYVLINKAFHQASFADATLKSA